MTRLDIIKAKIRLHETGIHDGGPFGTSFAMPRDALASDAEHVVLREVPWMVARIEKLEAALRSAKFGEYEVWRDSKEHNGAIDAAIGDA